MKIGIDKISFHVPNYYLDSKVLAEARNVDYLKFKKGLLINKMSVAPSNEDIITMAANATLNYLTNEDIEKIDLVLFATETGLDYSKAASTNLISVLGLKDNVRAVEIKQACYSATAAIHFAKGHILRSPNSKVLILGSDIAKYGINSAGEPTQGAGAVSMLISSNPKILEIEDYTGIYSKDTYDFYRPNNEDYAIVDGHYSNEMYQLTFENAFKRYLDNSELTKNDFEAIIFHIPYAKLALKTLSLIYDKDEDESMFENFEKSVIYNKDVGNIYTGSLYLSLISLLDQANLEDGSRVLLYSYGSGSVGEVFSAKLVEDYKNHLLKVLHEEQLANRNELNIEEYENYISYKQGKNAEFDLAKNLKVQLKQISNFQRLYLVNKK